jgi:hypothetical protein
VTGKPHRVRAAQRKRRSMNFADLKPGDEITVLQGKNSRYICRAKVIKHCEDHIIVVLWNTAGQRWNRNPGRVKPRRIAKYPGQEWEEPRR